MFLLCPVFFYLLLWGLILLHFTSHPTPNTSVHPPSGSIDIGWILSEQLDSGHPMSFCEGQLVICPKTHKEVVAESGPEAGSHKLASRALCPTTQLYASLSQDLHISSPFLVFKLCLELGQTSCQPQEKLKSNMGRIFTSSFFPNNPIGPWVLSIQSYKYFSIFTLPTPIDNTLNSGTFLFHLGFCINFLKVPYLYPHPNVSPTMAVRDLSNIQILPCHALERTFNGSPHKGQSQERSCKLARGLGFYPPGYKERPDVWPSPLYHTPYLCYLI